MCNIITGVAQYLGHFAMHLSCCFSVALTINQFIAVSSGLRYQSIITVERIKIFAKIFVVVVAVINGVVLIDMEYVIVLHAKMIRSRCLLNSTIFAVSGLIMIINLVYCNRVSQNQMRRLTTMEIGSTYWQHRKRIRKEVTVITSVVIAVLLPQTVFYSKIPFRSDVLDGIWLAVTRAMLQLFCALNPYLYLFTLKPLKKRVAQETRVLMSCIKPDDRISPQSRSYSVDTIITSWQDLYSPSKKQTINKGHVIDENASSPAFKSSQKEIAELKSTDIVQNQLSVGHYVRKN